MPFDEHDSYVVVMQIIKVTRPQKPNFGISRGYTEELWELTTACWHRKDPAERPTVGKPLRLLGNAASQWRPEKYKPSGIDEMDGECRLIGSRELKEHFLI